MTFTVQPRAMDYLRSFNLISDAIAYGRSLNKPFDVSVPSGAIVWTWEMRE
jgi:hypothetical protein